MSIGEETQEEALPQEAIEAIDAVNEERETELLAQSPQDDLVGDDSPSGAPPDESAGQPVEPPVAEVDEALAARAQFYGLDPTQHSPADLQSRMDDFDRMFIARGQAMQQQRQQQMQAQQQPPQTQAQNPQAQQQQQQHPFQQPFSYELDEDYGELGEKLDSGAQKLREEFYGVLNTVAGSLLQQQQVVSQYQQQQYQAQQEQIANDFHEAIQSLGQKEMFGDKPFHELPADSPEARQLTVVWQQALAMANGLQAAGLQVPDLKTLVDQTFRATFPDKIEARIRADQNQKLLNSSRNRMGGGNRVAAPHGHVPPTQDDPVNDEKIKEAWELWSQ